MVVFAHLKVSDSSCNRFGPLARGPKDDHGHVNGPKTKDQKRPRTETDSDYLGETTHRNPTKPPRRPGRLQRRSADRQLLGTKNHDPPRNTRDVPVAGPGGSSTGDWA